MKTMRFKNTTERGRKDLGVGISVMLRVDAWHSKEYIVCKRPEVEFLFCPWPIASMKRGENTASLGSIFSLVK